MRANFSIIGCLFFSPFALASEGTLHYSEFVNEMYRESGGIRAKALELEAELLRAKQTDLYFMPKVSAESKYKSDTTRGDITDSKVTASSLIFSTTIADRFKEKNSRVHGAELSLLKEKENLYKTLVENLIGIKYYNNLELKAASLEQTAVELYQQIEGRYISGIAKASDVEQARLLIQKIKTESESINKEIELLKSNIELATGIAFPAQGVYLPDNIIDKINSYTINEKKIYNNLDYKLLNEQADTAKFNAWQQDSLVQVSLVAEERYNNSQRIDKDSWGGIQVTVNLFDYDKKIARQTGIKAYQVLKTKMDFKYKELLAKMKSLQLTINSNEKELQGLVDQSKTTKVILANQKREYNISQSSYYEMLNTQYDYFALERKIIEMKISDTINKVSLLQISGELLSL
ncbi:MAG TPA: TolC family protein [Salmonella bongori]|uniref:TolC family protein n=2 Tax=Salmonella bongori TaxID=54736 RepID=A0A248KDF8_SALBN|nr:TolC family protein [Salmonella bongori]ASG56309.1 TolC family protein [Salmonella bongori serovar 66:z41:- str. SA19983605]ECC9752897.1 TolC family protein [Salmonella bongori]EDP8563090.1 TolC family protein [Salmonella bongori]EDP8607160.1 TolC family protein [Salmonella bongori]EDP8649426.1 TolC family protein [Salmonella bongori]